MRECDEKVKKYACCGTRRENLESMLGLIKLKRGETLYSNKKLRTHKNDFQKAVLNDVFRLTKFPTAETREDLALLLNHTTRGIQIWFQNNRHNWSEYPSKVNCTENDVIISGKSKKNSIDRALLSDIIEKYYTGSMKRLWIECVNYTRKVIE